MKRASAPPKALLSQLNFEFTADSYALMMSFSVVSEAAPGLSLLSLKTHIMMQARPHDLSCSWPYTRCTSPNRVMRVNHAMKETFREVCAQDVSSVVAQTGAGFRCVRNRHSYPVKFRSRGRRGERNSTV